MAPKKQKQASKGKASGGKPPPPASASGGPKLQLSAENESRLRRLLLNSSARPTAAPSQADDSLSVAQKAKRLRAVYEKLSCEGFSNDQIELALSALKDSATFEAALDWLCLNIPGNELPSKFSAGTLNADTGGSINVLVSARDNWTPSESSLSKVDEEEPELSVRVKWQGKDDALESDKQTQADWIRQYMEQQEEDEPESWEDIDEDSQKKVHEPRSYDVIAKEYHDARYEAAKAKQKKDKKAQEQAGLTIRKLKQELSVLGLSDDMLALEFGQKHDLRNGSEDIPSGAGETCLGVEGCSSFDLDVNNSIDDDTNVDIRSPQDLKQHSGSHTEPAHEEDAVENDMEEVELGGLFTEDTTQANSSEVLKKEKRKWSDKDLEGFWKKGDPVKIPKAVLHQFCQKSGWEAPKFEKGAGKGRQFSYMVSVVRKASGRGKSRRPGGLITLKLPDNEENVGSAEDAQNKVAAFALCQLFPDLPVHLVITEPYASLARQWMEAEQSANVDETQEDRRADFVSSLLKSTTKEAPERMNTEKLPKQPKEEHIVSADAIEPATERTDRSKEAESSHLRQDQEKRKNLQKYKGMLKARVALPIAELKDDILRALKEHDVLVVCGETGSGKTTQVPQFILDDMIESGQGGYCNIICTQPRRIAAISVAERVAEERCESSPGSKGSLVGYQVRLDSARTEKTKLLFCTTGILLRKIAGDNNLTGVTHVIVDEVHERSLLGDFLLIILKSLLERQSAAGGPQKLKIILMSATVDSNLFSRYFGNCPVITAQGRTHPVDTNFLEDVYETLNYRLASDSPAAIRYETSTKRGPVDNRRGKKNLVLSGWGDESLLTEECINPYYESDSYQTYSEQTQLNLRRLNEDVIDYDLLEDLVCHIDETCGEGAILIFLPGIYEIHMLVDKLTASHRFGGSSSDWVLPLHSSIAPNDQKKVFRRPPENVRKIIVATNIAETSITINDVVYVIDCGKHKENRYDPRKKLTSMVEDWISQANAKQRRGRAGRVKPGICFCLYTRYRLEKLMRPFQAPEMLRMPLVELCLQIKLLALGHIKSFLLEALEPPKEEAMNSALSLLYEVGALEGNEELTPLGYHLAKLPVDVLIGKMMLYGAIFGCLSPILSISSFLSYKSPFVYPKDEKHNVERAKLALLSDRSDGPSNLSYSEKQSDHILMMVAYKKWEKIFREKGGKAAQQFCSSYFLSSPVMFMIKDMRMQFATLLADIGLINLPKNQIGVKQKDSLEHWLSDMSQPFNMHSHHSSVVKAIVCAGLYPNVAATEQGISLPALSNLKQPSSSLRKVPAWYDGKREVYVHNTSINSDLKSPPYPFLVFLEKVETNRVFLRDTTIVSPYSILLFGGSIDVQHKTGLLIIDGWLKLTAPAQTAVLFKELRSTLLSVLEELIRKPESTSTSNEVIRSIIHLLLQEEKPFY